MAILVPYLQKGAEEFAGELGRSAAEKVKNLIRAIKSKLSHDESASEIIKNFEENPQENRRNMKDILKRELDKDKDLTSELDGILKELEPTLLIIHQKMKEAENVIGADIEEMNEGSVKVDQEIDKGKGVTGVKLKRLGKSRY